MIFVRKSFNRKLTDEMGPFDSAQVPYFSECQELDIHRYMW